MVSDAVKSISTETITKSFECCGIVHSGTAYINTDLNSELQKVLSSNDQAAFSVVFGYENEDIDQLEEEFDILEAEAACSEHEDSLIIVNDDDDRSDNSFRDDFTNDNVEEDTNNSSEVNAVSNCSTDEEDFTGFCDDQRDDSVMIVTDEDRSDNSFSDDLRNENVEL